MEIATKKTKVGTDHLRTKIIINDETLEHVNQFTSLVAIYLTNFPITRVGILILATPR